MPGKTMVDGTAYNIMAGKTMVDGTAYNITAGKTMIDGTAHDIVFGQQDILQLEVAGLPIETYESTDVVFGTEGDHVISSSTKMTLDRRTMKTDIQINLYELMYHVATTAAVIKNGTTVLEQLLQGEIGENGYIPGYASYLIKKKEEAQAASSLNIRFEVDEGDPMSAVIKVNITIT